MTVRSAEGAGGTPEERRASAGQRIRFEALVAVGEALPGGGGFEAESVDVSPEGMRLRTAYLPSLGDKLVCRFEGHGADVVTEGEVVWREEEARGGEFGLRFISLDAETAERLRAMCGPVEANEAESQAAAPGARVRLHIEGLGSPMKARVRDAAGGEIRVGSNLEFLRVGRPLEIEDVEHHSKREVTIDHVDVEIDPATNVPQLVVALRYAGAEKAPRKPAAKAAAAAIADDEQPPASVRPEALRRDAADAADAEAASDDAEAEEAAARFTGRGAKAARAAKAGIESSAKKLGPALAGAGARMKTALESALALARRKRDERAAEKRASAPRRTTAKAPGGALKSEGRRVVRDDGDDVAVPAAPARSPKRAAVLGSLAGLLVVLGVAGAARVYASHKEATPAPSELAAAALPAAAPAALPAGNGPVTASVPLFGATPLSTTETIPPPAPDPAAAPAEVAGAGDADAAEGGDDAAQGGDEGTTGDEGQGSTQWGQGTVKNPIVLKLKMDGPIERLNGAKGAMGFTLSLPDRRSVSSAADLARKDKRIASLNVVNNAYGAEVTVQFKDGVPPYMARAKGSRLEIAIGSEGKPKVAEKSGSSKKKTTAKTDKSHKKAAPAKKSKGGKTHH